MAEAAVLPAPAEQARGVAEVGPVPAPGIWHLATVIDDVTPGQPAYDGELFGPVAAAPKRLADSCLQV